ncbi:tetraspanin-9-like [Varroa destructor]|uniref:Tetraspanin n=1 Tax=Varroa destructor TaxID=109461 RepID=A0A7M7MDW4_VARDE|nr:tetraspanin-9-like [Varroa destructor]
MGASEEARRLGRKSDSPGHLAGLIKFLLVLVNCVVLLLEMILIATAIYLTSADKTLLISGLGQKVYETSFGAIIAGGILIILFTVFGIVGTVHENRCFLIVYFSLMFMIVMGEVGAIAFTVNKVDSLRELVRHNVFKSLKLYGSSVTITNAWSLFQAENQCCGMADPDNALQPPWKAYVQSKHLNGTSVPDSCCVSPEQHEECLKGVTKSIFDKDCFEVLKDLLSKHQTIILAVGLSSLFSTVVALFLTGSFIVLR